MSGGAEISGRAEENGLSLVCLYFICERSGRGRQGKADVGEQWQ